MQVHVVRLAEPHLGYDRKGGAREFPFETDIECSHGKDTATHHQATHARSGPHIDLVT